MTDYLAMARENFIGRRWLYSEIENALHPPSTASGVMIVGDPGAGKSALSAQLVCSRSSSRTIHDHILGYHLCKHSDKNTQIAGKFVRNLAEMIARRIPEYGYIVSNSSYILRSLNTDCVTIRDPVGCFEQAVLTPLRSLKNVPKENWYVVIDALDECLTQTETSHSIVYLLNNKLPRFPSWLKLVLTSRNESSVSLNSGSIVKLSINPEDSRNIEDIELFLTTRFYRDSPLLYRVKTWFGKSSVENTAKLISALLRKSQGNFLFVKEMIHHWETTRVKRNDPYALPETLGELYHSYFQRLYNTRGQFKPVRRVLELLVSTFHPMTHREIFDVLKMNEKQLEEDYDFRDRMKELGHFVRYGKNNTVTLYHLSLTEWLTSERNENGPFYVSKKKGHEVFCDYYLRLIGDGGKSALATHILSLAQHIACGGWREAYVKEFLKFPSQVVNSSDPGSNRTLLHHAATINSTDVLELLLHHFSCIDCADKRGVTPAFLAAKHGLVDNLALLVRKGARINRKTNSVKTKNVLNGIDAAKIHDPHIPFSEIKSKFWGATMLYGAAHGGHLEVVRFLLENGALISTESDVHLTALQVAAENGHVEVVKTLYKYGGVADQTALHHAVVNNRLNVVKYLLKIGIKDKCMRCDGSLYWLKTKHRYQSQVRLKDFSFLVEKHCKSSYKLANCSLIDDVCMKRDAVFINIELGELFDDKHLIFCNTALHAAVSLGHKAIIEELVSGDKRALACRDYSGRTPLQEAVRRNNKEVVELLLSKDKAQINSTCDQWQDIELQSETSVSLVLSYEEFIEYYGDVCHCGYSPLHLAARYGYLNVAVALLKSKASVGVKDCSGASPLHVAACHNHRNIIYRLLKLGADINSRSSNGSTPIHSAAACGAIEAITYLIYHGADINEIDYSGLTPLHYTIRNITSNQLDRRLLVNSTSDENVFHLVTVDRRGHLASFYKEGDYWKNTDLYRWLDAFIHLILYGADVNAADKLGRSALHIVAENGLADAVNVLLQRRAKLELHDRLGRTPLEVAIQKARVLPEHSQVIPHEKNFQALREYLQDHDLVVHLLLSSGVSFTKCNSSGESLLHRAVLNNQPYIAQMLLLKGANMNCKDSLGRTPLVAFLHNGGDWRLADAIFLKGSMKIKCGEPFNTSLFHLMSYFSPKLEGYNFFQQISCDNRTCSKESPFEKAVERHRLKFTVINSCLDAEGFTPLHRAAQGANIVAVRNLVKNGADVSLRSPQGHDALTLAILYSGGNLWPFMRTEAKQLKMDEASDVALELLRYKMKTDFQIVCDSSKSELTLYHLAASRGLVKFIKEIFRDGELHRLNVDCPNKDGITPMYLAKLCSSNVTEIDLYNPWAEVVQFIENQGGQTQYPNRDAELNLIYNRLYGWSPTSFKLNPRPDVQSFVIGLLSTYMNSTTTTMDCEPKSALIPVINEIGNPSLTLNISTELLNQLNLLKRRSCLGIIVKLAEQDIAICRKELQRYDYSYKEYRRHLDPAIFRSEVPLEIKLYHINSILYHLMMMWHKEVFQHFACYKIVFDNNRPFFQDDRKSKQLIKQYEDGTPLWYLQNICSWLQIGFNLHNIYHLTNVNYPELSVYFFEHPSFARERMGWTVDDKNNSHFWPLEFLVKFSFDLYRKYDYLKVLNVGLGPETRISLLTDKVRKILLAS